MKLITAIKKINFIPYLLILIFVLILSLLFLNYTINLNELRNVLSSLITVTGIFTAIILSFFTVKLFQIKEKKEKLYNKFYELSKKLMFFKRVCYNIKTSYKFWITFDDIIEFEGQYKGITFSDIHSPIKLRKKEFKNFWLDDNLCISKTKADLYLAIKRIIGSENLINDWLYDKNIVKKFTSNYLNEIITPCNHIWYYLDYKYKKLIKGDIADDKMSQHDLQQIRENINEINPKYKKKNVDRYLISEVSSEFHDSIIPDLIKIKKGLEIKIPKSIFYIFCSLVYLLFTGVMLPLVILLFDIKESLFNLFAVISVVGVLIGIVIFFILFYSFIKKELKYL